MKIDLDKNEIGFLLQALDQLPVKGREVAKLIVSVSGKLEGALEGRTACAHTGEMSRSNIFSDVEDNDE